MESREVSSEETVAGKDPRSRDHFFGQQLGKEGVPRA